MNTLKNHLILFDADCPMCKIYTQGFVNLGILDKSGRVSYQEFPAESCPLLDMQRAVNEIALVNQETGEVSYGIKSLFKVFGTALPLLKPVFGFAPFVWLMSKIYAFISYNRRVIIPNDQSVPAYALQPSFKIGYRIAYLIFTWFMTACILSAYAKLMTGVLPQGPAYREFLVCGGQVFFQGLVVSYIHKNKGWDYLGNMMTISVTGALLLLPGLVISTWLKADPLYYVAWFMCVAGIMLILHIRRSKLLGIGYTLTCSWILYRVIVLLIILLS